MDGNLLQQPVQPAFVAQDVRDSELAFTRQACEPRRLVQVEQRVVDFARGTTNLDQLTIVVVGTADEFRDELARIAPVVAVEGQTGPCPARTTPVAK